MEIKKINDGFSVSPQIAPADLAEVAKLGFKSVICNRPDGEAADQPAFAEIEASAKAAGLAARHIPVVGGQIGDTDVQDFADALKQLPAPILAYCRSGARSTTLWTLADAKK